MATSSAVARLPGLSGVAAVIEFQVSGTFEAENIDDALAYLADHFAEYATCDRCGLNDQTGAHERWCDATPKVRVCNIDVRPTLIR